MTAVLPGTQISSLPPCLAVNGNEQIPCVQSGTTKYLTPDQLVVVVQTATAPRIITSSGTVVVASDDLVIVVNKSVATSTAFTLPAATARNRLPLHVSDFAGTGGDMVFTAHAGDTIMGLSTLTVGSGGVAGSGGYVTLYPCDELLGWFL